MELLVNNIGVILLMLVLLFLSAFFSGTETAFFSIDRHRLLEIEGESKISSKIITNLMSSPSSFLVSVLLGNLTVNIFFFCLSTAVNNQIGKYYGTVPQVVFGFIVLGVLIICGEIMPKAIGLKYSLPISRLSCYIIAVWIKISAPLGKLIMFLVQILLPNKEKNISNITKSELKFLLNMSEKKGTINNSTSDMIEDIIALDSLKARHVMIPRVDIRQYSSTSKVRDAIEYAKVRKIYNLPIYEQKKGELIGYVDIRKLCLIDLDVSDEVSKHVIPAVYYPETKIVSDLLAEMQDLNYKIVFIVDEYGDIAGMISRERILSEVIQNVEYSKTLTGRPLIEKLNKNSYRIQAKLSFYEWREMFANTISDVESFNVASIGGFVVLLLGRNPKKGDSVIFKNLSFIVEDVEKNRIRSLILEIK